MATSMPCTDSKGERLTPRGMLQLKAACPRVSHASVSALLKLSGMFPNLALLLLVLHCYVLTHAASKYNARCNPMQAQMQTDAGK